MVDLTAMALTTLLVIVRARKARLMLYVCRGRADPDHNPWTECIRSATDAVARRGSACVGRHSVGTCSAASVGLTSPRTTSSDTVEHLGGCTRLERATW